MNKNIKNQQFLSDKMDYVLNIKTIGFSQHLALRQHTIANLILYFHSCELAFLEIFELKLLWLYCFDKRYEINYFISMDCVIPSK